MASHLSVFVVNEPGKLEKITRVLSEAGLNIRAVSMASTGEFGVVRVLVNDPGRGLDALKEHRFTVALRKILVAQISDAPGAMHALLVTLSAARVNVEDCYGFVIEEGKKAAIVFEVEKFPEAEQALAGTGIHLLTDAEIYRL
ncbi:MAG TPA: ACT domain-containing protein [Spirochaetia bacterium]|nr:ACT domain-containing protein [Spirochaetia bacterium]